jgi:hypothetical protein
MWSYPRASDGLQAVTNAAESSMFLHRALACPIHAAADLMARRFQPGCLSSFQRWQSNLSVIDLPQIWNPWTFIILYN